MKIVMLIGTLSAALGACNESSPLSTPSKIIGENELLPVAADGSNVPAEHVAKLDAFGWLPSLGCTGTHIGNGIVLTAGHCVNGGIEYFDRRESFSCQGATIEFGKRVGTTPTSVPCVEWISAEFTPQRDYAYLHISEVPTAALIVATTERASSDVALTIFSHPRGRDLEWSRLCVARPSDPEQGPDRLTYVCDTEPGSSGAAVLNDETGEIVAVHNGAGYPHQPWNYSTHIDAAPISD